jgi:hypothetical protein
MAGRTQDRCRGTRPGHGTDDTADPSADPCRAWPGAAADPVAALAMAGRTPHRCRCRSSGHGTDDTADHRGRQVRLSCGHGTGRGRRLIPSWRWRAGHSIDVGVTAPARFDGRSRVVAPSCHVDEKSARARRRPGRVPWPAAPIALQRTRGPPLWSARTGLLIPIARNRSRFIAIAIHLRRNRPNNPHPRNGPFLLNRRVPGRNFVTAVACLGEIRCRQSPSSRSGDGREGGGLDAVAGADGGRPGRHQSSKIRSSRAAPA